MRWEEKFIIRSCTNDKYSNKIYYVFFCAFADVYIALNRLCALNLYVQSTSYKLLIKWNFLLLNKAAVQKQFYYWIRWTLTGIHVTCFSYTPPEISVLFYCLSYFSYKTCYLKVLHLCFLRSPVKGYPLCI